MNLIAKRNLLVLAAVVAMILGAQMFEGGVTSPEPTFAQEESGDYDEKLLRRAVQPRVDVLPNVRGIRIRWNPLTTSNHTGDVVPPDSGGELPTNFQVQRRAYFTGDDAYHTIATVANDTTASRLKYIDDTAIPVTFYNYRLVVTYPIGYTVTLRERTNIIRVGTSSMQIKQEAFQVNSGVRIRWRPVAASWGQTGYRVERQTGDDETQPWDVIAVVPHDPDAKRLRITDTNVSAGNTYTYLITIMGESDYEFGYAERRSVTVE